MMSREPLKAPLHELQQMYELTRQVSHALAHEEYDQVFEHLQQREPLVNALRDHKVSESNTLNFTEIQSMLEKIEQLDKKNREVIDTRLQTLSKAIVELERERHAVNDLRSFSQRKQKQIVDVTY